MAKEPQFTLMRLKLPTMLFHLHTMHFNQYAHLRAPLRAAQRTQSAAPLEP